MNRPSIDDIIKAMDIQISDKELNQLLKKFDREHKAYIKKHGTDRVKKCTRCGNIAAHHHYLDDICMQYDDFAVMNIPIMESLTIQKEALDKTEKSLMHLLKSSYNTMIFPYRILLILGLSVSAAIILMTLFVF